MKRALNIAIILALLLSLAGAIAPTGALASASPATYTVLVGAENLEYKAEINSFFPQALTVHVGDTVMWKSNSMEIHTVSFHVPNPLPELLIPIDNQPSPFQFNPMVAFPTPPFPNGYDGTVYANSGIMGTGAGQFPTFSLTFNTAGQFSYICIVHGQVMSGVINVVAASVKIPSPHEVDDKARDQVDKAVDKVEKVYKQARPHLQPPTVNPDGSKTYHVQVGFSSGEIDFHRFAPERVWVRQGDQVEYSLGQTDMAPHTVTFLNGAPDIELVTPIPNPPGPPILLVNPEVVFPIQPGQPLTRNGIFSSGLLAPGSPNTSYTITVGDVTGRIGYICILHDEMGMTGELRVWTPGGDDGHGGAHAAQVNANLAPDGGGSLIWLPLIQH